MKCGKYLVLTKNHILAIIAILFLGAVVLVLLAALIPYAYANATAEKNKKVPICCTDRSNKVVSLTFDVAGGNDSTNRLLEILQQYRVPATFFVTGKWADNNFESVKTLYDSGMEIMNFSDEYSHITELSCNKIITKINSSNDTIEAIIGVRPELFRAPYDEYSNPLLETLNMLDMIGIQWDVDSFDNKGIPTDGIAKRVISQTASGSIIRFHSDCKNTPDALTIVIENLQSKGYAFLPVSAMIYTDNYSINHEGRQIAQVQNVDLIQ